MPPAIVDSEDESDLEIEELRPPIKGVIQNSKSPRGQPTTIVRGPVQASVQKSEAILSKRPALGDLVDSPSAKKRRSDLNDFETREVAINHFRGLAKNAREPSVAPQVSDSLNDSQQVTQPSSVDAEEALARDLPSLPSFPLQLPQVAPINELWLEGTLKHDFENHNPYMFDPSSTAPYDTAVQPLPVPVASEPPHISFEELSEAVAGGLATAKSSETDQSSFPWSTYIHSQPNRSGGPQADGPTATSHDNSDLDPIVAAKGSDKMSQASRIGQPSSHTTRSGRLKPHMDSKPALATEDDIWALPGSPDVLASSRLKAHAQLIKDQRISTPPIPLPDLNVISSPQVLLDALSGYNAKSSASAKSSPQTTIATKAKKNQKTTTPDPSHSEQAKKRKKSRASCVDDDDEDNDEKESIDTSTLRTSRAQISRLSADPLGDGTTDDVSVSASRRSSKRRKTAGFSEASISHLQSMGFDDNAVYRALSFTSGDVERAAEMLLDRPDDIPAVVDAITTSELPETPADSPKPRARKKKDSRGSPMVQITSFDASVNAATGQRMDDLDDLQQLDGPPRSVKSGLDVNDSFKTTGNRTVDRTEQKSDVVEETLERSPAAKPVVEAKVKKRGRGRPRKAAATAATGEADVMIAKIEIPAAGTSESKAKTDRPTKSKIHQAAEADPVEVDMTIKGEDKENLTVETTQSTADIKPDPVPKNEVILQAKAVTVSEKVKSTPGKTAYRVGLSRTTRIAPLLRIIRK